jgi:hypothetical protein
MQDILLFELARGNHRELVKIAATVIFPCKMM